MVVTSIEVPEGGTVGNRTITTRLLALAALVLLPLGTMGAGLGRLAVVSGLGQPLRAEIEIVALQRGESEALNARIASADEFRQAGVDYSATVPRVRTAVERRPDGRYFIVLTTAQPVEEPFLDLLIELNWTSGRLVRQYTFLLDPAEYKSQVAAAPPKAAAPEARAVETPRPPEVAAAAPPAPAPAPAEQQPPVPAEQQPSAPAPAVSPSLVREPAATYEVKRGDTLGKIAQQNLPDGVTLQQMLVALYQANEDAFIRKNMNLVRTGRILTIPDRTAVEAIAPNDAQKVVIAQAQDFNEYRAKLGGAVAATATQADSGQQRATGQITAKPDEAAAPKAPPRDQLRVSKADAAKGAKAAAAGRGQEVSERERALRESSSRVTDLERSVKELQQLAELKNKQLADLQKQAETAAKPAAPPPASTGKAPEPAKAPEPTKPVEVAKAPEAPKAPEAAKAGPAPKPEAPAAKAPEAPAPAEPPKPVEMAKAPEPAKAAPAPEAPKAEAPKAAAAPPKKPVAPPPPPEPSLIDAILDEPLYLAGGGGGILALLIGGYLWRKKRSAKLENSLLGVTTTDSSSVFGTTGGRSVDTGGSSLQTDFSQSGIGQIDTDEVDPVAEADVYMAYGRDAQAEEILKEALQKDPNRQAVRLKLLEIYASRKDLKAFETTAGEIYAATGGQGPEWQKALELGLSIDPSNPMYGGRSGVPVPNQAPEPVAALASVGAAAVAVPSAADLALDLGSELAPASIDFDLDADAKVTAAAPDIALDVVSQVPSDLGFDLNLGDVERRVEEATDFSPSGTFIMDAATKKAVSDMVEAQSKSGALAIDFELPVSPGTGVSAFEQA